MAASCCSLIFGGVVGCNFNWSSVIWSCRSKWTLSTCDFDSLNSSASYCILSSEAASDWIWSSGSSLHTLEMAYSSCGLLATASSRYWRAICFSSHIYWLVICASLITMRAYYSRTLSSSTTPWCSSCSVDRGSTTRLIIMSLGN